MLDELTIADFLRDRALSDPKVQRIVADVRLFEGLKENPGWRRLYEKVASDKERYLSGLSRRMMAGEKIPPEEIAYHRGFYQGAIWVLAHPEVAEKNLERAARMAYVLAAEEVLTQSEEETPYA